MEPINGVLIYVISFPYLKPITPEEPSSRTLEQLPTRVLSSPGVHTVQLSIIRPITCLI